MTPAQQREFADALDAAKRQGAEVDEPEGARYIVISDTLARQIAAQLRDDSADPRGHRIDCPRLVPGSSPDACVCGATR